MINNGKFTEKNLTAQLAGLMTTDADIEFIGNKETKTVLWLTKGKVQAWDKLPNLVFELCLNQLNNDKTALEYLQNSESDVNRRVELYVYHLYGDLDTIADVKNGKLAPSENFRDTKNTPALDWDSKRIMIEDEELSKRDLEIIDMILENLPDKAIAYKMGIAHSTFDFHKRNLFKRAKVVNKPGFLIKILTHHI